VAHVSRSAFGYDLLRKRLLKYTAHFVLSLVTLLSATVLKSDADGSGSSSNVRKSHVGRHVSPCSDNQNGYLPRQSQDTRFKRLVNKGVRAVCRPLLMTVLMLLGSLCWVSA
jgi:hypothetical protein